jgi:hypothetical protein
LTDRRAIRCDEEPRVNVVGGADPTLAVMERRIRAAIGRRHVSRAED